MNENSEEKSVTNNAPAADNEAFKNLASNLLKNEKSLGSIMQLATTLLKNDSLLNSVSQKAIANQTVKNPVSTDTEQQENKAPSESQNQENFTKDILAELVSLSQKLDNITNEISALKKELHDLKKQNSYMPKKRKH